MASVADAASSSVEAVFLNYVDHLQAEQDVKDAIRDILRDLDQTSRECVAVLHRVHQPGGIKKVSEIAKQTREIVAGPARANLAKLAAKVPEEQFYRFHNMFNWSLQRLVFAVAFAHYLDEEKLVTREEVAGERYLALTALPNKSFRLDLEDYLAGLTQLSNELSRLAVNSVTHGDLERPVRVAAFLSDLLNGFRLLNLKNDMLRKKFDSLKYDVKKVEEVVYDLAIRGLVGDAAAKKGEEGKKEDKEEKPAEEGKK